VGGSADRTAKIASSPLSRAFTPFPTALNSIHLSPPSNSSASVLYLRPSTFSTSTTSPIPTQHRESQRDFLPLTISPSSLQLYSHIFPTTASNLPFPVNIKNPKGILLHPRPRLQHQNLTFDMSLSGWAKGFVASFRHEETFENVIWLLKTKKLTPLMPDQESMDAAKKLQHDAAKLTSMPLPKASNAYVPSSRDINIARTHQDKVHNMLILFHIAAENFVSEDPCKLVIPPALYPPGSDGVNGVRHWMFKIGRQAQHLSNKYLFEAVKAIEAAVDSIGGPYFFRTLSKIQKQAIFEEVWNQSPLAVLKYWRKKESMAIYWDILYGPVDCPDRPRFRLFFKQQFVDMCLVTYTYMVDIADGKLKHGKDVCFFVWKAWYES
jgi:hypothetical protein